MVRGKKTATQETKGRWTRVAALLWLAFPVVVPTTSARSETPAAVPATVPSPPAGSTTPGTSTKGERAGATGTSTRAARTQTKLRCVTPARGPSPVPFASWQDCADTPEMVTIPGGRFRMGELGDTGLTYEGPIHEVTVPAFAIGRYEVTFIEWDACHGDGFCQKSPSDNGWGRGLHPVINMSWVDAQQFVAWLSQKTGERYRLPSEAEWEFVARAGTETRFPWGDSQISICDYANTLDIAGHSARPHWFWSTYCVDGFTFTAPVGSFPPNPWGVHDMQGNVWEWVQDCWHSDYTGAPTDGSAWLEGGDCGKRVNRGGGWGNNPRTVRSAKRDADAADGYGDAFGFRVARELPPNFIGPSIAEPEAAPDPISLSPPPAPATP